MPRGNYHWWACGYEGTWSCSQVIRACILLRLYAFPLCLTCGLSAETSWLTATPRHSVWLKICNQSPQMEGCHVFHLLSLHFCWWKTSAFLRTDGTLFGIPSDTNPSDSGIRRKYGTTVRKEINKQLQRFCILLWNGHHMWYLELHKHALLPGNCNFSCCKC